MAKSQDAKKTAKKEPLKTAKEKKEEKEKKRTVLKETSNKCSVFRKKCSATKVTEHFFYTEH
ncbi:hypothetical protein [Flavobacterium faecale]|uniref:hypothetical protein n=1 Tax=Flavobacterium faecale TaxID=1355330 RepID=UPI003AAD8A4D